MVHSASEYNMTTLWSPRLKGRPLRVVIGILMTHPITWFTELAMAAFVIVLSLLACLGNLGWAALPVIAVAALFAAGFPAFYVFCLWLLDIYEREPKRIMVSLFLWGAASAFLSLVGNTIFGVLASLLPQGLGHLLTSVVGAPVIEEIFKGVGLVLIAGHHEMEDTYDGILYGFATGMGFAAVENFLYFTVNVTPGTEDVSLGLWLYFILYRSVICALGHGSFTATTGALIGFLKNRFPASPWVLASALVSVLGAIALHGAFNLTAAFQGIVSLELFDEELVPVFHGPFILALAGFWLFIAIPLALWETRRRLARQAARQLAVSRSL